MLSERNTTLYQEASTRAGLLTCVYSRSHPVATVKRREKLELAKIANIEECLNKQCYVNWNIMWSFKTRTQLLFRATLVKDSKLREKNKAQNKAEK